MIMKYALGVLIAAVIGLSTTAYIQNGKLDNARLRATTAENANESLKTSYENLKQEKARVDILLISREKEIRESELELEITQRSIANENHECLDVVIPDSIYQLLQ